MTVKNVIGDGDEIDGDILVDWSKLNTFILSHATPRKVIKIFITKLMKDTYTEKHIDDVLHALETNKPFPNYEITH